MSEAPESRPQDHASGTDAPEPEGARIGFRRFSRFGPGVAGGLVFAAAMLEWAVGGLTANGALEIYVFTWASLTAALWFVFDRAERSLGDEARAGVAAWLTDADAERAVRDLPERFAALFDQAFGERHFSVRCFRRSAWASLASVTLIFLLYLAMGGELNVGLVLSIGMFSVVANFLPDYLSLLETRFLIRWAGSEPSGRRVALMLMGDVLFTGVLALTATFGLMYLAWIIVFSPSWSSFLGLLGQVPAGLKAALLMAPGFRADFGGTNWIEIQMPMGVFFYSTFFTSVWLWLYLLAIPVSRLLVRMNRGVGFLLRATDVEAQPLRSVGFVSVVVVSLLFLVGLPLVVVG